VGLKEDDDKDDDEDRQVYDGVDSILGVQIHRDQSQILNVLRQQATYELKKGQPLVKMGNKVYYSMFKSRM
jgi:hypothetical protein